MAAAGQNPPRKGATVKGAAMKPKIYISHPRRSIEEVAKSVGVSKRRLKELMELADELSRSDPHRTARSNGNTRAPKPAKPITAR